MIGTIVKKPIENYEEYKKIAEWCNLNNATIIDKGNYYEVTEIKEKVLTEQEKLKAEVETLENQTGYTRVLREIISVTNVSQEVKTVAEKIEKVAIKLRK